MAFRNVDLFCQPFGQDDTITKRKFLQASPRPCTARYSEDQLVRVRVRVMVSSNGLTSSLYCKVLVSILKTHWLGLELGLWLVLMVLPRPCTARYW